MRPFSSPLLVWLSIHFKLLSQSVSLHCSFLCSLLNLLQDFDFVMSFCIVQRRSHCLMVYQIHRLASLQNLHLLHHRRRLLRLRWRLRFQVLPQTCHLRFWIRVFQSIPTPIQVFPRQRVQPQLVTRTSLVGLKDFWEILVSSCPFQSYLAKLCWKMPKLPICQPGFLLSWFVSLSFDSLLLLLTGLRFKLLLYQLLLSLNQHHLLWIQKRHLNYQKLLLWPFAHLLAPVGILNHRT